MARPFSAKPLKQTTLDRETLYSMHKVILGGEFDFPLPWMAGFCFRDGSPAFMRQRAGGPCGVLAAVQAFVLRELRERGGARAPTIEEAGDALVAALAHIVWSARVGRLANVVSCSAGKLPPLREAVGELVCTQCSSLAEVMIAVRGCIGLWRIPDGPGIILLLYSLLLTRGLAMVQRDADFPTPLVGSNGYCSQELVNLLLIGRAHSNVFDGEKTVGGGEGDGESGEGVRLRGIPRKAQVGFLTLFERQGQQGYPLLVVGNNLKRPLTNIFVVQSESHYSCLWAEGECPDLSNPEEAHMKGTGNAADDDDNVAVEGGPGCVFDLMYFDQMAERDNAVRLTIRRRDPSNPLPDCSTALPPLENVILTRWPDAEISWNGEEIIL